MAPKVGVVIPTYNRRDIVAETVQRLWQYLEYEGEIVYYVGCDGSDDTPDYLVSLSPNLRVIRESSGSLGANVNRLWKYATWEGCEVLFGLDDDHHLLSPLKLNDHVAKLMNDDRAVRIHMLMDAKGDEHFDHYKFTATLDRDRYWRVHPDCEERFLMSFRPHLIHARKWIDVFSYLPEGHPTGMTEWLYSGHCKDLCLGLGRSISVLVPLHAYTSETWAHVGESWNRRGL